MTEADRERWEARYREGGAPLQEPSGVLAWAGERLPRTGRCLDVAGGAGRNALWLARRGLSVLLVDIAPTALAQARAEARGAGLVLETQERDLEALGLPEGRFDLVLVVHYLERALLAQVGSRLVPGGLLLVEHPTRRNLERHARPAARWLLEEGELPGLVEAQAGGLEVLRHEERWNESGRHEARLLARRPG